MRRIHALELEDQSWMLGIIRDFATDFLAFMIALGDSYAPVIGVIRKALEGEHPRRVVDLGSGGGGPWPGLFERVRGADGPLEVLLTDRYPSREAAERLRRVGPDGLSYRETPVDAMAVPAELSGFRTMFTALHHFRPDEVRRILLDAVGAGRGIGAFEFSERSVRGLLLILLSPFFVLLFTPFIRPFRWSRLFWTYIVPVVPLVVLFDGTVSALRSYRVEELRAIVDSLDAEGYAWEVGAVKGRAPIPVIYLVGRPVGARRVDGEIRSAAVAAAGSIGRGAAAGPAG